MAGTIVNPNLHAALVHFPVALIIVGVLMEVLSVLFWRKSAVRAGGRWMIVLGILCAIPTLTTGMYALRQTANPGVPYGEHWDTIASSSSWTDAQWDDLVDHIRFAASGAILLVLGIVVWIAGTDNARRNMYLLGIVVLVVGAVLVGIGAFHGGELVFEHGTGVKLPEAAAVSPGAGKLAVPSPTAALPDIDASFSSLEIHLLLAGCAIAVIAAAIGLSIRLSNVTWENRFAEEKAIAAGYRPAGKMGQDSNLLSIPVIYPGAFWILALVLLLVTATVGLSVMSVSTPGELMSALRQKQQNDEWRPVLHIYYGLSIIGLAAILGMVMKVWPRRRLIMGMLCTLMLIAIVCQAWTGTLMLFDGQSGPILRFNRALANRPVGVIPVKPLPPSTRPVEPAIPATTHTLQTPVPTSVPANSLPIE